MFFPFTITDFCRAHVTLSSVDAELFRQFQQRELLRMSDRPTGISYRARSAELAVTMTYHEEEGLSSKSVKEISEKFQAGADFLQNEMQRIIDMAKSAEAISAAWKIKLGGKPDADIGIEIPSIFEMSHAARALIGVAGEEIKQGDLIQIEHTPSGTILKRAQQT